VRLVFVLAFAATVLGIGWTGVFMPGWSPADLLGDAREAGSEDAPMVEVTVREENAPPPANVEPPAEVAPVEAMETPPEPVPAMTFEDVFEVPAPPEIVRPLDVDRVKPERPQPPAPQTQPRRAAPPAPGPVATAPGSGTAPATSRGKGGKPKTPQPPYPAFARSGKMTGTVVVSLLVDAAGSVTSATVARSSGHPALDSYTCNYIRRSWRWPEGGRRTFNQPVSFRLR